MVERDKLARSERRSLYRLVAECFTPPDRLTVSEWAERHRVLTKVSSSEPGQWRNERTPFLTEIMDSLTSGNGIERVVFVKPTQIGGTECGNNFLGWIFSHNPGPAMMVMPTLELAKRASRQRISPMIQSSALLRGLGMRESGAGATNSVFSKTFPGGVIVMCGSQSAATLRSMPARYIFCDEIDNWERDVEQEGNPLDLVLRRTDSFNKKKKVFYVSTPGLMESSHIEPLYMASDRRRYHVPCPECGAEQHLEWGHLKWTPGAETIRDREVWYECRECEAKIDEASKTDMLLAGRWVAEGKSTDPALRGYKLNSLYSPTGWLSWKRMVHEFLEAKHEVDRRNYEKLKTFVNTRLAETWDSGRGESVSDDALFSRREPYRKVPQDAYVLTAGVDVQKDRLEVEVVAWGEGNESWAMDWHMIPGDPDKREVWDELDQYLNVHWEHESGVKLRILSCLIDSGYATKMVYSFVAPRQGGRVFASKGIGGEGKPPFTFSSKRNNAVRLVAVGTDGAKQTVHNYLRYLYPENRGPGYCHFPDKEVFSPEYFAQLTGETRVRRYQRGFEKWEWRKTRPRNEALDARVLAYTALLILNPNWVDYKANMDALKQRYIAAGEDQTPVMQQQWTRPRGVVHEGI